MKCFVSFACVFSVLIAVGLAAPFFPAPASTSLQTNGGSSTGSTSSSSSSNGGGAGGGNGLTNILSNIDLPGLLRGVNSFVGLVRQFCPPLSQILDNVIQNVTSTAFRVFGRAILQQGGLGGRGGSDGDSGSRVNVVLPTFPPDDDDYDEDEDDSSISAQASTTVSTDVDLRITERNSVGSFGETPFSGGSLAEPNSLNVGPTGTDPESNTINNGAAISETSGTSDAASPDSASAPLENQNTPEPTPQVDIGVSAPEVPTSEPAQIDIGLINVAAPTSSIPTPEISQDNNEVSVSAPASEVPISGTDNQNPTEPSQVDIGLINVSAPASETPIATPGENNQSTSVPVQINVGVSVSAPASELPPTPSSPEINVVIVTSTEMTSSNEAITSPPLSSIIEDAAQINAFAATPASTDGSTVAAVVESGVAGQEPASFTSPPYLSSDLSNGNVVGSPAPPDSSSLNVVGTVPESAPTNEILPQNEVSGSTPVPTAPYTSQPSDQENTVAKRHVRVVREAAAAEEEEEEEADQDAAASELEPAEDLSADADDQDRNKRFLPFGASVDGHASGGSGNFLFDIIRNTADRAARTVGTVYRMVAGTQNLGWGLTATAESSRTLNPLQQLVAGSGATEETDEKENAPGGVAELDIGKTADGYSEGIPGPITRLFVIANRGIANLVQDLILRLAQTSERLVNFKARLVTSLI